MPNKIGLTFKTSKIKKPSNPLHKNVFESYDSDDVERPDSEISFRKTKISRADQQIIEDAVKQDPLIFEYDAVVDETHEERSARMKKLNSASQPDRKPRYIHNLLKASEERQIERERRIERRIQEERKQEGELFADKEVFVTNAYREKLRAIEEMDRARIEAEKEEALLDVKKQGNLNSFYRFMFKNGLFKDKADVEDVCRAQEERVAIVKRKATQRENLRRRECTAEESSNESEDEKHSDDCAEATEDVPVENEESEQVDVPEGGDIADNADDEGKIDDKAVNDKEVDDKEVGDKEVDDKEAITAEKLTERDTISKEEILKKLEERIKQIFESLQKKTIGERFEDAREEYITRKHKRLHESYVNPQLHIENVEYR